MVVQVKWEVPVVRRTTVLLKNPVLTMVPFLISTNLIPRKLLEEAFVARDLQESDSPTPLLSLLNPDQSLIQSFATFPVNPTVTEATANLI